MKIKPADIIIIIIYISIIVISFAFIMNGKNNSVIIENGKDKWVYPLKAEEEISVTGPLGNTTVIIKNSEVSVIYSPCKNKLCISKGKISKSGQWIACLPNRIFVRISGSGQKDTDAVSF